jgi:Flp pilus assembly protein TadG
MPVTAQHAANAHNTHQARRRQHGIGLIWSTVVLVALCMLASLAVDYGHVQVVKAQLGAAADAAALAGAELIQSDPAAAVQAALDTAGGNVADGKPVVLLKSDVVPGIWDETTRTFAPAAGGQIPNAVMVTATRSEDRGDAVALAFARVMGAQTCAVHATAIALARPVGYAMVGLDYISMKGRSTNSYRTKDGSFSNYGTIASNGDITLGGNTLINGDAFPGVGKRVIGANHVTGSTTPLTHPLNYPQADPGNAATDNDNAAIESYLTDGVLTVGGKRQIVIPAGTYYLNGIDLQAGAQVRFGGKVTLYVTGSVSLSGHADTYDQDPANFKLVLLGTGATIDLSGGSALYADIYAPGAALTMGGNGDIYGSIVARSIDTTGNGAVHYDLNLPGGVELVQ